MKVTRAEKFEGQLKSAETQLREELLRLLPDAVVSGTDLCTNSEFHQPGVRPGWFAKDAEALLLSAGDKKAIEDVACYVVRNPLSLSNISKGENHELFRD